MTLPAKLFKRVPQFTRTRRHMKSFWQHSDALKLYNLATNETEKRLRKVQVSSHPYILFIDPVNVCNLKCPLCPTGFNQLNRPQKMMSFETFKTILKNFEDFAYEVSLHNWGEPFLNPDIFSMIEHARKKNVGTNLSSNLNKLSSGDIDNIIDSGLEYLIVSLDATTSDIYQIYRVKGNFDRVLENLKALVERKKERKINNPIIEWQFIVMKHNQHQIDEAKALAPKIGVDLIRFIAVGLPFGSQNKKELAEKWFPANNINLAEESSEYNRLQYLQKEKRGACFYLYCSVTINPDGGISPCCRCYNKNQDFGNILEEDFDKIWNNDCYQSARSLFSSNKRVARKQTACDKCSIFKKINNT